MTRVKFRAFSVIAALIAVFVFITNDGMPTAAAGGLVNPGFESGALDGNPVGWTVVNPVGDVVKVVDEEGPAEFSTYADMGNITVSPYRGNLMLRTGTPQRLDQNQNKGDNRVRQTFSSTSSSLDFAFRVFSWEPRGQDLVRFDIKDGPNSVGDLAAPIQLRDANNAVMATCADIPCEFAIDVGDQGQFIDSGWQVVSVVNLPTDGRNLTLSYTVSGSKDAAKPTWAVWDNVNTPPVAKFAFAPSNPREGDVVRFEDLSYDPDPGDSIVSRTWVIDGQTLTTQNPYFVFPDEANYVVSISVQDTFGAVTIALDNTAALDGDPIPDLVVGNADPLVNALDNMEVLAGHELTLRGRFLDAGYLDQHTASWSIDGNPPALVEEENEPFLSSGLITGVITPGSNLSGTLTVEDGDGGSGSDSFTVTVVPDSPAALNRHEPNGVLDDPLNPPPVLEADNAIVSFIQQAGDVDFYKVSLPGGGEVTAGTEMLVSLTDLSADIDVAILSEVPAEVASGWSNNGWSSNGWSSNGWSNNGWSNNGWSNNGWSNNGWSNNGWSNNGWSSVGDAQVGLQSFEKSGVSWADIGWSNNGWSSNGYLSGGNEVTALDVDLAELGLGTVGGDNVHVAALSANRGLDDEVAWARSENAGTTFYVAVFASDGEESLSPYTLSLETIEQPDIEFDLGPLCDGSPLVTTGATQNYAVLYDYDDPLTPENDAANAVLITQKERLVATYDMDEAAWNDFMGAGEAVGLMDLAQHDKVRADVLSVPSIFMDQFDEHPCSIEAANSAATQIRTLVNALYPDVEHRVVLGSDTIIPFLRKLDYTVIGNQKDYLLDSFTKEGSPLFAALLQGYFITDDHLGEGVDDQGNPTSNPWQGDQAYVPTIGVGRLVETPQEILWHVQAAVASDLTLSPSSATMFGYDTFADGAELIRDNLDAALDGEVVSRTDDQWTAEDLRCLFLGVGDDASCGVRDIVSANGHSTHWAILAAAGWGDGHNIDYTDHLGSSEVAALGNGTQPLKNTLVFAMGCNLGFNSPDANSLGPDEETGLTPAMDFPQAFAQHGTTAILSTGFGYSDDNGIGGHEKLFSILPSEMFAPGATVGQALAAAKQRYLGGLVTVSVYDLKVSMETSLYGLPMYTVEPEAAASMLLAVQTEETLSGGTPAGTFALTTFDAGAEVETALTEHQLASNGSLPPDGDGIYYTLDGEAQGGPGRTLQPSFEADADKRHYPNSPQPANPVHGVRITGAAYADLANDPVFTRPKHTWDLRDDEVQQCQTGYSPSTVAGMNSFQRGQNLTQTLVGVAGQFQCTETIDGVVRGVERLYSSLSLELRRCAGDNTDGAVLGGIELRDLGGGMVEVRIEASDNSGLSRVEVLRVDEGQIVPFTMDLAAPYPAAGVFNIVVPSVEQTTDLLVQVEDDECNITLDTFKSAGLNFLKVDAGPDQLMPANRNVTLTGTIENFDDLAAPAWFDWEFGDGKFLDGVLLPADLATVDVTVDASGTATFSVQHTYAAGIPTPITATLEVHDSAGGNGSDETHIVCDPIGDADGPNGDWTGCASSNTSTTMTISVTVDGAITGDFQYRVYVDAGTYRSKGKRWLQPPDGVWDAQLKYNGGQVNGLNSLTAQVIGSELRFTFDLAEFGLSPGKQVQWYAETQAGIPGEPTTGKVDRMLDVGWLVHTIQ